MLRFGITLHCFVLILAIGMASGPSRVDLTVVRDDEPDPRRADRLVLTPGQKDLDRLQSVEGKPKWQVLRTLGHPTKVLRGKDGSQVWEYPWSACCQVFVKNGVCVRTYYTAGY